LDEALRLGVQVIHGAEVETIDLSGGRPILTLESGQVYRSDVVVGADGLWSSTRSLLLGRETPPIASGDMAFRATFSKEQLQGLGNTDLDALISKPEVNCWIGPNAHAVLYPVKNGTLYNLVLICPDTLPPGFNTVEGEVEEMRNAFAGVCILMGNSIVLR
jgi:salicylate hydroxylase